MLLYSFRSKCAKSGNLPEDKKFLKDLIAESSQKSLHHSFNSRSPKKSSPETLVEVKEVPIFSTPPKSVPAELHTLSTPTKTIKIKSEPKGSSPLNSSVQFEFTNTSSSIVKLKKTEYESPSSKNSNVKIQSTSAKAVQIKAEPKCHFPSKNNPSQLEEVGSNSKPTKLKSKENCKVKVKNKGSSPSSTKKLLTMPAGSKGKKLKQVGKSTSVPKKNNVKFQHHSSSSKVTKLKPSKVSKTPNKCKTAHALKPKLGKVKKSVPTMSSPIKLKQVKIVNQKEGKCVKKVGNLGQSSIIKSQKSAALPFLTKSITKTSPSKTGTNVSVSLAKRTFPFIKPQKQLRIVLERLDLKKISSIIKVSEQATAQLNSKTFRNEELNNISTPPHSNQVLSPSADSSLPKKKVLSQSFDCLPFENKVLSHKLNSLYSKKVESKIADRASLEKKVISQNVDCVSLEKKVISQDVDPGMLRKEVLSQSEDCPLLRAVLFGNHESISAKGKPQNESSLCPEKKTLFCSKSKKMLSQSVDSFCSEKETSQSVYSYSQKKLLSHDSTHSPKKVSSVSSTFLHEKESSKKLDSPSLASLKDESR